MMSFRLAFTTFLVIFGGGAAGGYGVDVAARQAAGRFHGSGSLNQALNSRAEEVTFKDLLAKSRKLP